MQVNVTVQLDEGEQLAGSAEDAATAVLEALGADLIGDHCVISVTSTPQLATVGTAPTPPPMATPHDTPDVEPYRPPEVTSE